MRRSTPAGSPHNARFQPSAARSFTRLATGTDDLMKCGQIGSIASISEMSGDQRALFTGFRWYHLCSKPDHASAPAVLGPAFDVLPCVKFLWAVLRNRFTCFASSQRRKALFAVYNGTVFKVVISI